MTLSALHRGSMTQISSAGRLRAAKCFAGVAVAALSVFGAVVPAVAATPPTLAVVVVGAGTVTSQPAGIACPGKCTATFAAGTSVVLTATRQNSSTFLRWGGSCTGTGTCTVTMATLMAVAAQFVGGPTTHPRPTTQYVAAPGPYATGNSGVTFYVAPGGSSIRNIFVPGNVLTCTPSGGLNDHLEILQAAIKPDGSFSAAASQAGVLSGSRVKFTYTFAGRFQAATTTAAASAAGTWREDIAYASGTTTYCTSNAQAWTATLNREPPQQKALVKAGSYSGRGIAFSVASGSIQNVAVPGNVLTCTPSGGLNDHLTIAQVTVNLDGSFTAKTSQTGVVNGSNATFTYTFAGYFEGPTPAGAATVAGTWREDIAFASGTTTYCTSNAQIWTATRS